MARRYRRRIPLNSPLGILVLLVVVATSAWRYWESRQNSSHAPSVLAEGSYQVERVIDGDTLKLANQVRIRLIGADTPETVMPNHPVEPWGPEATAFTKQFIGDGPIRLEFDGDRKDRYGRTLAYVWVGDRMLNEELIRAGLARARTEFRYAQSKKALFRRVEQEAKSAGRGIWSDSKSSVR